MADNPVCSLRRIFTVRLSGSNWWLRDGFRVFLRTVIAATALVDRLNRFYCQFRRIHYVATAHGLTHPAQRSAAPSLTIVKIPALRIGENQYLIQATMRYR